MTKPMKPYYKVLSALFLLLPLLAGSAIAGTTVEAGRVTLSFAEEGWQSSEELSYNLEVSAAAGTIRGKAKVLTLPGADAKPQAVLYVGSTWGRSQVYTRGGKCGEDPQAYVRDFNDSKLENYRCVYIAGPYSVESLLNGPLRGLQKASKSVGTSAIPTNTAYYMYLHVTAKGGVIIHAEGMFTPNFAGLPGAKPVAQVPEGLSPAIAAWADQFTESAVETLSSFRGGLPVPKLEFSSVSQK
jgi:hypothetical protein